MTAANIRFAVMLADAITINVKLLATFSSRGFILLNFCFNLR